MSLQVRALGAGPDLALVHGWGAHAGVWQDAAEALARRFRVHLVDLPGYGGSPPQRIGELRELGGLLAQTLPEGISLCGWSLGALACLELALRHPERTARLVLVAATPCFLRREDWPHGVEAEFLEDFGRGLRQDAAATLRRFHRLQSLGEADPRAGARQLDRLAATAASPNAETLSDGLALLASSDLRAEVDQTRVPTLLLHGKDDAVVPCAAGEWLAQRLPQARLRHLPDCGHAPFLSKPEAFLAAVTEFLDA